MLMRFALRKTGWLLAVGVIGLTGGLNSALAQDVCGDALEIRSLGGSNRFSKPVTTLEQLQTMVESNADDIRLLLARSGFQGNPDDFFAAIRSGQNVSSHSFPPGQRLGWMFFRKGGQPTVRENLCWAGKDSFTGWEVQFTSGDNWYAMVIPEVCGNLSFLTEAQNPVCAVSLRDMAGQTCEQTEIVIDASGSRADTVRVEVSTPSGQQRTLTAAQATSANRWTFDSSERNGTFTINVVGSTPTSRGNTLECRAQATVQRDCCDAGPPSISLRAGSTQLTPGEETTLTADPEVSDCTEIDSVTIGGDPVNAPYQTTFSSLEPGTYPITAEVIDGMGQRASASVTLVVAEPVVEKRGGGSWTIRPFLGPISTGDDEVRFDFGDGERRKYATESGFGLGFEAEYMFTPRVGLGLGALLGQTDFFLELDIDDLWDMTSEESDVTALFVGPLFHLTPNSRADLFVGPLLGWVDYSSVSWNLLGRTTTADFDGDIAIGAQLGLDVPFRADGPLGLYVGALYFASDAEADQPNFELGVDPLMIHVGLFYDIFRNR